MRFFNNLHCHIRNYCLNGNIYLIYNADREFPSSILHYIQIRHTAHHNQCSLCALICVQNLHLHACILSAHHSHASGNRNAHLRIRSDLMLHDSVPEDAQLLVPLTTTGYAQKSSGPAESIGILPFEHQPLTEVAGFNRNRSNGYCALTYDGYAFNHTSICKVNTIWQCARRSRLKCPARIFEENNDFRVLNSEHNEACRNVKKRMFSST